MDSSNWYTLLPEETKRVFDANLEAGHASVTFSPPLLARTTTDHSLPHVFAVEVKPVIKKKKRNKKKDAKQ